MCGTVCGITTTVIGVILIVVSSFVGYGVIPGVIENIIIDEVVLINDTIQLERFETVPFALNFSVRIWNITNADTVLNGGVPEMREAGPYIYKLYQTRIVEDINEENITYRRVDHMEFDAEGSYPNTEDDLVTIVNVPYHAILQVAESLSPALMTGLNLLLNEIYGQYNSPVIEVRVRDLLFDGLAICQDPSFIAAVACSQVAALAGDSQNIEVKEDGSLSFSLLSYKDGIPSEEYVVNRGLDDSADLGIISSYAGLPHLLYWVNGDEDVSMCNMINGTDSGIFAPFIDNDLPLYAINTDICRSVELRYQNDVDYEGIPAVRFAIKEWFLNNNEGCYCLNVTRTENLNDEDGCLLQGVMELFTCTGAFLVLSYPHFLYADFRYRNGIIGMNPIEEEHRIFLDIEPNTGTIVRGAKRAQFNIFMRPIAGIPATQNLRTSLTPIFWVEEGMSLPEEFVDELTSKLLRPLNLLDIFIPIIIAVCCLVFVVGIIIIVRFKLRKPSDEMTNVNPNARVS